MAGATEITPDVLIVGAGPTGLALAALLETFGVRFRLIDRAVDRVHESRALAVQARTLELFQSIGLAKTLVECGNPSASLFLHLGGRRAPRVSLAGFERPDTRFPFILFVSQAKTEEMLLEHLSCRNVLVERAVELVDFVSDESALRCRLVHSDGREEEIAVRYLVGCDGAHSTVRRLAGIEFQGDAYLQEFALGDVEADGPLEPDSLHSFAGRGVAMFFPLGSPATWRVIAMAARRRPRRSAAAGDLATDELRIDELQSLVDTATGGDLRVYDPAWLARFRLHHRQAAQYRKGRVFLAGDAAHIHSPVGGQGMNTGIQDAWNLGWKLAFVTRGAANPDLLDSYAAERWPVGRYLLRYTDRLFATFVRVMSPGRVFTWIRRHVVSRILPFVLRSHPFRRRIFRFVSELGIHYRESPVVLEKAPGMSGGVRAGERLPDAGISRDGEASWLQQEVVGPRLSLLLCGPRDDWDRSEIGEIEDLCGRWLAVFYLVRATSDAGGGMLVDTSGNILDRLGVRAAQSGVHYVIRPDGHVAFRGQGTSLRDAKAFLFASLRANTAERVTSAPA